MRPLRVALFVIVFSAGSFFLETWGWLASGEAWLASGFVAALIVFCVPEPATRRDPKLLFFLLSYVIVGYGVFFKLRWWLTGVVGDRVAAVLCMFLFLMFGAALVVVSLFRRAHSRTDDA